MIQIKSDLMKVKNPDTKEFEPLVAIRGQKGDSIFFRYSSTADGSNFTETWSPGQAYIGVATGLIAPTDKSKYIWALFKEEGTRNVSGLYLDEDTNSLQLVDGDGNPFGNAIILPEGGGLTSDVIQSFSANPSVVTLGGKVRQVILNWSLQKTPKALYIGDTQIDKSLTSYTIDYPEDAPLTASTSWTLRATFASQDFTKTASTSFLNYIYYGVAANSAANAILGVLNSLTKERRGTASKTFTVTSGEDQYVYYICPTRLAPNGCIIKNQGMSNALPEIGRVQIVNEENYTEEYIIHKSNYSNLGTQTFEVTT